MSTDHRSIVPAIIGLASGVVVATALAYLAWNAGNGSVAKGVIIGASLTLVAMVVLWIIGPRAGLAGRVANSKADERDSRIVTRALADGAVAMFIAAAGGLIWSLYGADAIAVAGIVMWAGLITFAVSAAVRSRVS